MFKRIFSRSKSKKRPSIQTSLSPPPVQSNKNNVEEVSNQLLFKINEFDDKEKKLADQIENRKIHAKQMLKEGKK